MIRPTRLALLAIGIAAPAYAQDADTARVHGMRPVVVTAERAPAPLSTSTAAVTVLRGDALRRLPVRNLPDALRMVPGVSVIDFDGMGDDPRLTVRGFYGAGEAEYVTVLVDGAPLNAPHTGVVDWDVVPLAAIERVEVLRGGASSLYGDAAIGGVVNIVTRTPPGTARWRAAASGHGGGEGSGAASATIGGRTLRAFGGAAATDGFRDGGGRAAGSLGASLALEDSEDAWLSVSTLNRWRTIDDAGPLAAAALDDSRTQANPFYRFDRTEDRFHRIGLDGGAAAGRARVTGYLAGELADAEIVRTLTLAPVFADTKVRALETRRVLASAQVDAARVAGWDDRLVAGFDASYGGMDSAYETFLSGGAADYAAASGGTRTADEAGDATRAAAAAFARYEVQPAPRVRLSLGARIDWLRDAFTPRAPTEGERTTAEHTAFSPRAAVNVQLLRAARHDLRVYASAGRSFKAATPDQLFDRRTIPLPMEPWKIVITNPELRPQYGVAYEAGAYHQAELVPGTLSARLSLAAYEVDMRDELDFDLQTYRYVNLGRSRHRGVEAGAELFGPAGATGFVSYTLQDTESRFGENRGNALKAIPRHTVSGGATAPLAYGALAGVTVTHAGGAWLDDANTVALPAWTRVDARLSLPILRHRVWLEAMNVLDASYSTSGFPDSADPSTVYYFPAAGRVLRIGIGTGG